MANQTLALVSGWRHYGATRRDEDRASRAGQASRAGLRWWPETL